MKTTTLPILAAACLAVLSGSLLGQGSLTPPGAPAPTMKTLDEVEPRIAVNGQNTPGTGTALFRITQPGSYYLSGNIDGEAGKHGIEIALHNVTLDLNGFALIGVPDSLNGVHMGSSRENVVIRNGHVRSWGGSGINTRIDIGRIERIVASRNGGWGISDVLGTFATHIVSCEALSNGAGGIRGGPVSRISECIVRDNTGPGISAGSGSTVANCTSLLNSGPGIQVGPGSTVTNCIASSNSAAGISADSGSTIANCTVRFNRPGILAVGECLIANNTVSSSQTSADGKGIHVTGWRNRIEGNNVVGNHSAGIEIDIGGNWVVKNSAGSNTGGNYVIAPGNQVGPIGSAATSTSPWANLQF